MNNERENEQTEHKNQNTTKHKQPTFLPADNPTDYGFFFDTGKLRKCNLAPERFTNSEMELKRQKEQSEVVFLRAPTLAPINTLENIR